MKFLKNKSIIVILALLTLWSCEDFLTDDIQYLKEKEVVNYGALSRGIIDDIYGEYTNRYSFDMDKEYLTDNATFINNPKHVATGNWPSTSNPYESVWAQSYRNIRQIYTYIEKVHDKGLPFSIAKLDSLRNVRTIDRYYGEAFFLKAWSEWELLKTFAGPGPNGDMLGFPIVNEVLEKEEYAKLSRNTFDECVAQIFKDLDTAMQHLPFDYSAQVVAYEASEKGRASGIAALALKAKVALWAASPAFNPTNDATRWITAAQYIAAVIDTTGGLRNLQTRTFKDANNVDFFWRTRASNKNNSLEKDFYPPSLYGNGKCNPTQNLVDAFPDANGFPITDSRSSYSENDPYSNRDSRFYEFIFFNNDISMKQADSLVYNAVNDTVIDFDALQMYSGGADNFGGFISDVGTRTGYYMKKFLNLLDFDPAAVNPITTDYRVYVHLGLTDMYLMYAEAINEAYGQPDVVPAGFNYSAKEVLAEIRERAGVGDTSDVYLDEMSLSQTDFRTLLRNERRIELCFSGERFHDLRRWKAIDSMEDITGMKIAKNSNNTFSYTRIDVEPRNYEEKNYYLPIPYTELLLNPNLVQNAGW